MACNDKYRGLRATYGGDCSHKMPIVVVQSGGGYDYQVELYDVEQRVEFRFVGGAYYDVAATINGGCEELCCDLFVGDDSYAIYSFL